MNNRRQAQSIDGFTLHRNDTPAASGSKKLGTGPLAVPSHFLRANNGAAASRPQHAAHAKPEDRTISHPGELPEPVVEEKDMPMLSRSEIDESLDQIDETTEKPKRAKRRLRVTKKKVIIFFILVMLIGGGYFAAKLLMTSNKLFSGNIFDLFGAGAVLKADDDGRTNILVFGTSEDDPGHAGADLTDSIMIVSLDQEKKNAVMVSVPRDLWVKYGEACLSGFEGRINVVYECGASNGTEADGCDRDAERCGGRSACAFATCQAECKQGEGRAHET